MKTKLIFILIFFLFAVPIVLFILLSRNNNPSIPYPPPTPTPVSLPPSNTYKITNSLPQNGAKNVDPNQNITISLSTNVSPNDFVIGIQPVINFTTDVQGNNIIIKPASPLNPGTTYTYLIKYKDGGYSNPYSFTTSGTQLTPAPSTYDSVPELEDQWNRINHPDLFLSNHTPYQTGDFSVNNDYTSVPTQHFFFTVSTPSSQGKQAFLDWLKSLGLTSQQIQALDIRYQ